MKQVLYIDSCIRGEISRTRRLARAFLEECEAHGGCQIQTVKAGELDLLPLDRAALDARQALLDEGKTDDGEFDLAKQFAAADLVVVASPMWDMGIPAKLKTYFEHVSVAGITFRVAENGDCIGCCAAKDMVFLTTRGMQIEDGSLMEQSAPYLRALAAFFGVGAFHAVSAWGLDMVPPNEENARLSAGMGAAKELARTLLSE